MTMRFGAAMVLAGACLAAACGPSPPTPVAPTASGPTARPEAGAADAVDAAANVRQEYLELTQKAMAEVRAWSADGHRPDPRPFWTGRLEEFAVGHPLAPEAADALAGAMQ